MKKFFLLFAVLGLFTFTANAQKPACSMAKKATCSKSAKMAKGGDMNSGAALLAAQDDSIESRVCATSGNVSYVQKNTCAVSGTVSYTAVKYCDKSKAFVNVSPSDMKGEAAPAALKTGAAAPSCTKSKAACTKSAKAAKVSKKTTAVSKKACTKKNAACCKKGATAKTASAKLVKMEE